MLNGIDVSSYNASYQPKGQSFVFIKATEGRSYINPRQWAQAKQARDAGLVTGFYHFLWPGNITAQAEYFVEGCDSHYYDPLVCDWEYTGDGTTATNAEKDFFIREVKRLRPHKKVLLYCNRDFWLTRDRTSYAGDGLWIADYVTAGKPRIQAKWLFHQYTSSPHDKNKANFSSKAKLAEWTRSA
ncbi:GH25 family lysozyme [Streptomyces sp. NPDC005395]|uniref:GH25 family lysozyme n=1 Tax=Streptomyces sp. NPDC005395 TaxID=3157042 RepID=UPI0033B23838